MTDNDEELKSFIEEIKFKAYKLFDATFSEKDDPIVLSFLTQHKMLKKALEEIVNQQLDILLEQNSSNLKLITDWNDREQESLKLFQKAIQSFIDNLLTALKVDFINSFITKFKETNQKEKEIFFKRQEKILKEYKSVKLVCYLTSAIVLGDLVLRFI